MRLVFYTLAALGMLYQPAKANVADSYSLQITEAGIDFAITVNGLPLAARRGVILSAVPYFLESYLHDGPNEVSVAAGSTSSRAALQLLLTAPTADPLADGPELGRFQCGPTLAMPCKVAQTSHFTIVRSRAPSLLLWHADAVTPGHDIALTLAKALTVTRFTLLADAVHKDWSALFAVNKLRGTDLAVAGGSAPKVEAQMAKYMAQALVAHPGLIGADAAPTADQLVITPLPGHLLGVSRRDGQPVIRLQLGDGAVAGSSTPATINPRDSGDEADRFITGQFALQQVIFGSYGGTWQLIR